MNRLFLVMFVFTALSIKISAQQIKLEKENLSINFPGDQWERVDLGEAAAAVPGRIYAYVRKDSYKEMPTVSIYVEDKKITKSVANYAKDNAAFSNYDIEEEFTSGDEAKKIMLIPGAVGYKMTTRLSVTSPLATTGYIFYLVDHQRGITIKCTSVTSSFEKFNDEFIEILKSVKFISHVTGKTDNNAAIKTIKINAADYFPLRKKMSYTYKDQSSLTGTSNFTEEYTFHGTKTVNGNIFKGYLVKSKDEAKNNMILYYNNSTGNLKMHTEIYEWEQEHSGDWYQGFVYMGPAYDNVLTRTGRYMTITELKGVTVEGEDWIDTEYINGNKVIIRSSIEGSGITMDVRGTTYTNVLKLRRELKQEGGIVGATYAVQEIFYARGIGKIKITNTLNNGLAQITDTQELLSYSIQ